MKPIHFRADQPISSLELSPDCTISYTPSWLSSDEANHLFSYFSEHLLWERGQIRMFGRWLDIPRRHVWYGDETASYGWSGQRSEPKQWNEQLHGLRVKLQTYNNKPFNGVLANLYRNGQDCMHWHADNEAELGLNPMIAAISLGAERRFSLRHNQRQYPPHRLQLGHGSLLLMTDSTQAHWQHALPRSKRVNTARISLTFRHISST